MLYNLYSINLKSFSISFQSPIQLINFRSQKKREQIQLIVKCRYQTLKVAIPTTKKTIEGGTSCATHVLAQEVLLICNTGTWVKDCPTFLLPVTQNIRFD